MDTEKEQTILGLAYDLEKGLSQLEADLDKALKRGVEKDSESGARPMNPSVLGEIIEILGRNNRRLGDLSILIRNEILTKLDKVG